MPNIIPVTPYTPQRLKEWAKGQACVTNSDVAAERARRIAVLACKPDEQPTLAHSLFIPSTQERRQAYDEITGDIENNVSVIFLL
ncbi:MAG TPA: hypothetical protein VGO47_01695 [Chlamydiales bacterium]|nr:hypothetical protein [Chlamydiales bacterium]